MDNCTRQSLNCTTQESLEVFTDVFLLAINITRAALIAAAVINNSLVVHIIRSSPQMRTFTYNLMLNKSVGDLLGAAAPALRIASSLTTYYTSVQLTAFVGAYVMILLTCWFSSNFTLTAITIDRFLAIVHPRTRARHFRNTRIIIPVLWAISLLLSIAFVLELFLHVCWCLGEIFLTYMVLLFLIPLTLMIILNSKVVHRLWAAKRPVGSAQTQTRSTRELRTRKVIKLIVALTASFCIFWSPYMVCFAYVLIVKSSSGAPGYLIYFTEIAFAESAFSPMIYIFMCRTFRQQLRRLICCHT